MKKINDLIVSDKETARTSLKLINDLAIPNIAVFVVNDQQQLVGSLTDGDIRRGLLNGKTIDDPITSFMNKNSKFFIEGDNNFEKISRYKEAGIRFIPVLNKEQKIVKIMDLDKLRSIIPVNAILMAGGKGERLKPLTDHVPKPMLEIGGKPIIVRNIERLAGFGVNEFSISVRHMADQIVEGVNAHKGDELNIDFVKEEMPLGTIGSVRLIKDIKNDVVLLMNSDLLTNIDFHDFYKKFIESKADMQVATIPYHVDVPYAVMEIDQDDRVLSFSEKPRFTYYSNAGIYLFKKELIDLIPDGIAFDATHFMEEVIKNNKKLISYPILSYWLDIGRIDDFYKAQEDVKHINF